MKQIIVTIGADGTPTVETKGFAGAECLKATAALEAALGGATKIERTAEFYAPVVVNDKLKARG